MSKCHNLKNHVPGYAYVVPQEFDLENTYSCLKKSLNKGTIFKDLDLPDDVYGRCSNDKIKKCKIKVEI